MEKSERQIFGKWVKHLRNIGTPKKDLKRILNRGPAVAK